MPVENIQFKNMIVRSDIGVLINYASKINFENIDLKLDKPGIAVSLSNSRNINVGSFKAAGENQLFWIGGTSTKKISLKKDGKKMNFDDVKVLESIKDQVKIIE